MSSKSSDIEEILKLAKEDLARDRLASAEKYLAQAILLNNQVSEAFHLMGLVYSKKGKLNKAILAFQKCISIDPFHTEAAIALSSLYNDMGKYQEGAMVYQKAKRRLERVLPGHDPRINGELAKRHFDVGSSYLRYERYEEACKEFEKAQELEPHNAEYVVKVAQCLSRMGSKGKAIEVLSGLVEREPECIDARVQLGVLYHTQKKLSQAYQQWQEALALNPEHKGAQMYLSMVEDAASNAPAN